MQVLFRLDATAAIGWGHFKRCLALARALQARGATVAMAGHSDHPGVAEALHTHAIRWHELAAGPHDEALDARHALAACGTPRPALVVVDHYGLGAPWHAEVRQRTGACVAAIDDLADRPLAADLLIDQNPAEHHTAKYAAVLPRGTPLCGGLQFAMLDPVYADHAPADWHDTVGHIGLFLGGTDPANHSGWALQVLRHRAGWRGPVAIATTSANPHLPALRALAAADPALELVCDQPHLAEFHARCDLQIGAGGGASWERCCLGVPTVALVCADNQRQSLQPLARAGAVRMVEAMARSEAQAATLATTLTALIHNPAARATLRERGRALVDGRGAERLAARLITLMAPRHLTLRPATLDDAERLLAWRNDPATRQASHTPDAVDPAGHRAWLETSLASTTRRLWIACLDTLPVGTLRADRPAGAPRTTLSWTVAPALRGCGIGRAMVALGARALDEALHAEVRVGNTASLQIAQAAGLVLEAEVDGTWHLGRAAR